MPQFFAVTTLRGWEQSGVERLAVVMKSTNVEDAREELVALEAERRETFTLTQDVLIEKVVSTSQSRVYRVPPDLAEK